MPRVIIGTFLALVAAGVLSHGRSRWMFATGTLLLVLVLLIPVVHEVPLNRQIQSWTAAAPPPEWRPIRDPWLQRHLLRTSLAVLAFVSALLALTLWKRLSFGSGLSIDPGVAPPSTRRPRDVKAFRDAAGDLLDRWPSSTINQARAIFQSRITVMREDSEHLGRFLDAKTA